MPITEWQRAQRKGHLGASDIAAILGVSPYGSALSVYLEKTGELEQQDKPAKWLAAGNAMEDAVLAYASEELGLGIIRNQFRVSKGEDGGILSATLDALADNRTEAIEAKTVNVVALRSLGDEYQWGGEANQAFGGVPVHYYLQVQQQCYVAGLERVHIAAMLIDRGIDFAIRTVERDEETINMIVQKGMEFWTGHVMPMIPPEDMDGPSLEIVRRFRRETGKSIVLSPRQNDIVASWEQARDARLFAKKHEDRYQAMLLMEMGDAEVAVLPDGREITYRETKRAGYTVEATSYRTMRIGTPKQPKKGLLTS